MAQQNIVLFYPRLGWMDTFILDLPLSLVYVGDTCRKNGIEIRMFDQRVEGKTWKRAGELHTGAGTGGWRRITEAERLRCSFQRSRRKEAD